MQIRPFELLAAEVGDSTTMFARFLLVVAVLTFMLTRHTSCTPVQVARPELEVDTDSDQAVLAAEDGVEVRLVPYLAPLVPLEISALFGYVVGISARYFLYLTDFRTTATR